MKTPDEIKNGLECCLMVGACNDECPYYNGGCGEDRELKDALAYIQQLEAALPKWISVEERLPDKPDEVLAVVNGYVMVTWYHPKTRCFETGAGICFFVSENMVTHWMPLPEPPKEK